MALVLQDPIDEPTPPEGPAADESDDSGDEVPVFEPDSLGTPTPLFPSPAVDSSLAPRDSIPTPADSTAGGAIRVPLLEGEPGAPAETLSFPTVTADTLRAIAAPTKRRIGIFGLHPAAIVLAFGVLHYFLVKAVTR